jgi:uncharacterized protein
MESVLVALVSGLLFGAGLTISQMVNPAKVAGFLDVAGDWDPSLALVMGGALTVTAICYRLTMRRGAPLFATDFRVPTAENIDAALLGGAALFGVGWGLGGFCPGPAIASLAFGIWQTALFVVAMVAAMALWEWMPTKLATPQTSDEPGTVATLPGSSPVS